MSQQIWWYLARASGLVAWLFLAVAVIWGLLLSTRLLQDRRRPAWLLDLHRWLGGLAVTFTAIHLGGLVADTYEHFGFREIAIPFASEWRPEAVAWGVVGLYLLVAVQATSLLMRRLPRRLWKGVHYLSFVLFFLASMHAAAAGTDASTPWYRLASTLIISITLFATLYRFLTGSRRKTRTPRAPGADHQPEPTLQSAGAVNLTP
jgi:sulfoxide reductase heme-binding subunit YedZ